jgi:hypothetical protein
MNEKDGLRWTCTCVHCRSLVCVLWMIVIVFTQYLVAALYKYTKDMFDFCWRLTMTNRDAAVIHKLTWKRKSTKSDLRAQMDNIFNRKTPKIRPMSCHKPRMFNVYCSLSVEWQIATSINILTFLNLGISLLCITVKLYGLPIRSNGKPYVRDRLEYDVLISEFPRANGTLRRSKLECVHPLSLHSDPQKVTLLFPFTPCGNSQRCVWKIVDYTFGFQDEIILTVCYESYPCLHHQSVSEQIPIDQISNK